MGWHQKITRGPHAGRFRAMYRDPTIPDPRKCKRQVPGEYFPSKELAKARADQVEDELRAIAEGIGVEARPAREQTPLLLTYGLDVIEKLDKVDPASTTRETYRRALKHMLRAYWGEDARVSCLTPSRVESYYAWLRERVGPGHQSLCLAVLRHIARRAVRDEIPGIKPPEDWFVTVRAAESHRPAGTADDLELMMQHMPGYLGPALLLAVFTGMRRGEIAGLTWSSVDLAKGLVWVRHKAKDAQSVTHTKNHGRAWVPMIDRLHRVMRAHHEIYGRHPSGRVFIRPSNVPVDGAHLAYRFRVAREAAGVDPGVRLHSFRATFATVLHRNGVPREHIQRMMRHKNWKTTSGYIRDDEDAVNEEAAAYVAAAFAEWERGRGN